MASYNITTVILDIYNNIIDIVTVLEKRSNFALNINFELGLQNVLSSMKNGQS